MAIPAETALKVPAGTFLKMLPPLQFGPQQTRVPSVRIATPWSLPAETAE